MRRIRRAALGLSIGVALALSYSTIAQAHWSTSAVSPTHRYPGTQVTARASDRTGCISIAVGLANLNHGQPVRSAPIPGSGAFTPSLKVPTNAPVGATQLMFQPRVRIPHGRHPVRSRSFSLHPYPCNLCT
jgi:hypothetical protein